MVDVTSENFVELLPKIEEAIAKASFIALDFEFLGLHGDEDNLKPSLFDSPSERYGKMRDAVRRFPPVQWGIAIFTAAENGQRYNVDVYNVYLFKRYHWRNVFSFSLSSVSFLAQHGFDFNKMIRQGITFANRSEIDVAGEQLKMDCFDYQNVGEQFARLIEDVQFRVGGILSRAAEQNSTADEHSVFTLDIIVDDATASVPWAKPMKPISDLQEAMLLYSLYSKNRGITFRLKNGQLEFQRNDDKNGGDMALEQKKNVFESILMEIAGAARLLMAIVEAKLPVIGHNCFFDLLFLHQCFWDDLPENYNEWKDRNRSLFSTVFDTRYLAEQNRDVLSNVGVTNFTLETLANYFMQLSSSEASYFQLPEFTLSNEARSVSVGKPSKYHDAAFDALATGKVFIRLALLQMTTPKNGWKTKELSPQWRSILHMMRPCANRIPTMYMPVPFIDLDAGDPKPSQPPILELEAIGRRRNGFGFFNWLFAGSSNHSIDMDLLKRELLRFGTRRCDVKALWNNRRKALVATNNDATCARVLAFVGSHSQFQVSQILVDKNSNPIGGDLRRQFDVVFGKKRQSIRWIGAVTNGLGRASVCTIIVAAGILTAFLLYR